MNKKKISFALLFGLLFTITIFNLKDNRAEAASSYQLKMDGKLVSSTVDNEMKDSEVIMSVSADNTWDDAATVTWTSSQTGVVSWEAAPAAYGANSVKLVRRGPGFTTITATVKQGTASVSVSCKVKVGLAFDYPKTGIITATTTESKILVFDKVSSAPADKKQIYLKYVEYDDPAVITAVTGSAIIWESNNEGVATVNESGLVTAVGGGSTTISATTTTEGTAEKAISIELNIVVAPEFTLTLGTAVHTSTYNIATALTVMNVPSTFVLESNAKIGTNLTWKVYSCDTAGDLTQIKEGDTGKLSYTVSNVYGSGNVSFNNVKTGTYVIYAFANEDYGTSTNAPYAYMKIVVPPSVGTTNVIMNVGDTYNIVDNSNFPSAASFAYSYDLGNSNIAIIEESTGNVTAKKKGKITLRLTYRTPTNLFPGTLVIADILIDVTVIDGISLSETTASLYTKGTLMLIAAVTDPTQTVVWSTSDSKIATVDGGKVTGVKPGTVTITASQTINGVMKKSTCEITVEQSVTTIVVTPAEVALAIDVDSNYSTDTYQTLKATITPDGLSGINLKWLSSNPKIVEVTESTALTATIHALSGGTAVISAINQDNVVVGYCHVTVQQAVTSIVLSETNANLSLATKSFQLRATAYPENALNKNILWTSTDVTKAKVDANGLVTLLKPGTVSIIATSDDNAKVKAICNININIPVVSVALDEIAKTMYVGQAQKLAYTLLPVNATNSSVTWTSTNAAVVTVDATGKVTAKSTGTAVIILKSLDGGFSVYCTIAVKQVATNVKFDKAKLDMKTGETYKLTTTYTPANSTDVALVWESSDSKVATVDSAGTITAKAAGTAVISARTEAGGVTFCTVKVTQGVAGLILNFSKKTIYTGQEFEMTASVSPSSASTLGVTWVSSDPAVATISSSGKVKGLTGGVTVITCTTVDGGYVSTCVITVRESVTKVLLNYDSYRLGINNTVKLVATASSETATNQKVTWSSSNKKVATVTQKGKVTGIAVGKAVITATAKDGSDADASCEIRVVIPVTSVSVNKSYVSLLVGQNAKLKATIKPKNATYKYAKWTSSDDTIAMVDGDGVVTALKAGNVTVTAEAKDSSGKKAMTYVTIRDRVPATGITVQDKKLVMISGESKVVQTVTVPATSTDGYSWSSDNAAVAYVNKKSGKIIAKATGSANITVMTDSGKTALIEVIVIGLNLSELTLEQYTTYPYPLTVEGATSTVSWSIDKPQIAVVTNGSVSSRAVGTATITATVNGRKLKCKLTVVGVK
ncbi:MAG: Ig-like domain-containing protein [Mobilitalea sp.]